MTNVVCWIYYNAFFWPGLNFFKAAQLFFFLPLHTYPMHSLTCLKVIN